MKSVIINFKLKWRDGSGGVFNFECATQMVQTEIRGPEKLTVMKFGVLENWFLSHWHFRMEIWSNVSLRTENF